MMITENVIKEFRNMLTGFSNFEQLKVFFNKIEKGKKDWNDKELKIFWSNRLREGCLQPLTKENLVHIANLAMILWNMEN